MDTIRFGFILTGVILLILWIFLEKDTEVMTKGRIKFSGLYYIFFKDSAAPILWAGLILLILGIYAGWY